MPIHDLIDVGVFSETKEHMKRLNLQEGMDHPGERRLRSGGRQKALTAGIDPHNEQIDRNPGDNLIEVDEK